MNSLRNLVENVGSGSVSGTDIASNSIRSITDNSGKIVNNLADSASEIVSNLSGTASGTATSLVNSASDLVETGVDTATGVIDNISNTTSDLIKTGVGRAGDTLESVVDSSANLVNRANDTAQFIVNDAVETTNNIKEKVIKLVDDIIDPEKLLSNPIIYCILIVLLSMYGPRLSPKLPPIIKDLFNNNVFRFVVIVLIAYLSNNNLQSALLIAVGFTLILSISNTQQVEEDFEEHYSNNYSSFDTIREVDNVIEHYGRRDDDGDENENYENIENNLLLKKVV